MKLTFTHGNVTLTYEGDFGGEVDVYNTRERMSVPAAALIAFVAEFVRQKKMLQLESATQRELFGLKEDPRP
jgi:hypothetical protein